MEMLTVEVMQNNITPKLMKTKDKYETIWEQAQRLKEEAKKLAELHKDKPVKKYDLK